MEATSETVDLSEQAALKQCHLKEFTRKHYVKKEAKAAKKATKENKYLDK